MRGINSRCRLHGPQDTPPAAVLGAELMTQHHRPITGLMAGPWVCDGTITLYHSMQHVGQCGDRPS